MHDRPGSVRSILNLCQGQRRRKVPHPPKCPVQHAVAVQAELADVAGNYVDADYRVTAVKLERRHIQDVRLGRDKQRWELSRRSAARGKLSDLYAPGSRRSSDMVW